MVNPLIPAEYDWAWSIALVVVVLAQAILVIAAVVSILASPRYTGGGKLLWIAVVLLAPFLGPLGWFLGGRRARIRTSAP